MTANTALNAERRRRELESLAEGGIVDVLVIGGGVTGAGVALDAASRGLNTVLVEARDLAFGTSRWSSKLVHGGLRYLASGDIGVARESAAERHILMTRTAPHLVRPLATVVPLNRELPPKRAAIVRAGFVAGDALRRGAGTPVDLLPRSRKVDARAALRLTGGCLATGGLRGGLVAYDGQLIDDARLVVGIARTAAAHGARVLTRLSASKVTGNSAVLTDELTGQQLTVNARSVISAAGVWAGDVDPSVRLRPSRGTHLVLPAAAFGNPTASITVPVEGSISRFVFAMPEQLGRVYLGLTDEEAPGPIPDVPEATDAEIDFLIATINKALANPISRSDVLGTYSGLRPLLDADDGSTADVSRKHAVITGPDGVISIVGGKLTTYRQMAEDVLNTAIASGGLRAQPCRTKHLPLVGAGGGADRALPASLVARFGGEAGTVVQSATVDDPIGQIAEGIEATRAEIEYAFTHEGALDVDDVLHRRTRIGLVAADADRARAAVEAIAAAI